MLRRNVLVVEDDRDAREFLRTYLEQAGLSSTSAANGREGLQQLVLQRPMLVLLDLSMPVMNGWEFRAAQQALTDRELASIPVVVTSALIDCAQQAAKLHAVACLPKPLDVDRLLSIIDEIAQSLET
jgi:CheY-like chemotaxis protein